MPPGDPGEQLAVEPHDRLEKTTRPPKDRTSRHGDGLPACTPSHRTVRECSRALREERRGFSNSGYSTQQRTRPQTIGYSLVDSSAGLAAWITEKLRDRTDSTSGISPGAIHDNVMLYWLPRTGASSARLYWESLADVAPWIEGPLEDRDLVAVPTGCTVFSYELQRPSRLWAEKRFPTSATGASPARGGHFPALEQSALFVDEIRRFFRLVR